MIANQGAEEVKHEPAEGITKVTSVLMGEEDVKGCWERVFHEFFQSHRCKSHSLAASR